MYIQCLLLDAAKHLLNIPIAKELEIFFLMNKRSMGTRHDYVIFLPINFQTLRIILLIVIAR